MATIWRLNEHLQAGALRVRVGDLMEYAGYVHGSVGNELGHELLMGSEFVTFLGETTAYHTPENMKDGWTGGDGATATLSFRAVAAGAVSIRFLHYFRGDIEESYDFSINIEELS
jgi:hypothetical protein